MAAKVAKHLEWFYKIVCKIIHFGYCRAESRYFKRMVEKQYKAKSLVRDLQHTHLYCVTSKLSTKFDKLCKVFKVRSPILTLKKIDTDKVITASHDAVRVLTVILHEVPLQTNLPVVLQNS